MIAGVVPEVCAHAAQTMINIFLSPGSVPKEQLLYENQGLVQAILLLVAVFSIPAMLLGKPCLGEEPTRAAFPFSRSRPQRSAPGSARWQ